MGRSGARNTTGSHNGYVRRKQVDDVASLPPVRSATIEQIYFPKSDEDGNRWPATVTDKDGNEAPAYKVFTIARAVDENTGKRVMLKGGFGPVCEGELVTIAEGKWKVDGRYGPFFQVYRLSLEEPVTRQSLVHFLQKLPGVGEKLAEAIADTLGTNNGAFDGRQVLKAIDKDPQILRTVRTAAGRGLGGQLDQLIDKWEELRGNQMAYLFLGSLGVGDADAEKIARWFGPDRLVPAIKANPYAVCEVPGIGFKKADHLGRKLGIGFDDPRRLAYGVEHVLKEIEQGGHVCLTRAEILTKAPPLLADGNKQIPAERIEKVVEEMLADGRLVSEVEPSDGIERIYSKELWTIETRLYRKLHDMLMEQRRARPAGLRKPAGSSLTNEQWQAVEQSFRERVSIITGGPGVGKCVVPETPVIVGTKALPIETIWDRYAANAVFDGEGYWADLSEPLTTTSVNECGEIVSGEITKLYKMEVSETGRRVRLSDGSEITMTKRHRLLGPSGWTNAPHAGDWVAIPRRIAAAGEFIDPDLTELLAWQIAEGFEGERFVRIFQENTALLEELGRKACSWAARANVKINIPRVHVYAGKTPYLEICSVEYRRWLEARGYVWGQPSAGKQAPPFIMSGDEPTIAIFLRAFAAAEGHIAANGNLEISTASEKMVEQLRILFRRLGIVMFRREKMSRAVNGAGIYRRYFRAMLFGDELRVFANRVGISDQVKHDRMLRVIDRPRNTNVNVVPARDLLSQLRTVTGLGRKVLGISSSFLEGQRDISRERCSQLVDRLDSLLDGSYEDSLASRSGKASSNYLRVRSSLAAMPSANLQLIRNGLVERAEMDVFWARVESVEDVELSGWVYDLEVDEHHNYVAAGMITHNTSTLKGVLDAMDSAGEKYTLLAPTGKAAKRMEEQTGRSASTIHRRLGYAGLATPHDTDHEPRDYMLSKVKVGEVSQGQGLPKKPVYEPCDVVVIDESSMLDLRLAERVLTHLGSNTRLILVGDPDQLPPVGAGSLLLDLLASERVPTTKLTKVFRQAEDSLLVVNAHRIRQGLEPYWTKEEAEQALQAEAKAAGDPDWSKIRVKEDFRFVEACDEQDATRKSLQAIADDAREFGVPETEVMAMSPFRRGESGVYQMNRALQNKHNPNGTVIRGGELEQIRLYDQVMNTANRYANSKSKDFHDVFNGDVGKVVEWEPELKRAWVDFGQGPQPYSGDELDALVPAYCATVHKRQGLEAPVAVFTCPETSATQSPRRLSRQALYTALTRAKERATLVGSKDAIRAALAHDGSQRGTVLDLRIGRIEPRLRTREEIEQDVKERWQHWAAENNVPTAGRAITTQNFKALAALRTKKQAAAKPAPPAFATT